jgi:hypothetical protein
MFIARTLRVFNEGPCAAPAQTGCHNSVMMKLTETLSR